MKKTLYFGLALTLSLASCSDDDDDKYYDNDASLGTTLTLQGGTGGSSAINSVYVDFSEEIQTAVQRASWHLGFNCGSDFGVILNNTLGSRAIAAQEGISVGTIISEENKTALKASLSLGMGNGTWDLVDDIDGDLSKSVIKEGKVYVYDSGDAGLELYKLSVAKKDATTYTLSYAVWNSDETKTIDIKKNTEYNFIGVSLVSNKVVNMQPQKEDWDLVWGRSTFSSAMKPDAPFVMADIILVNNKNGVKTCEIIVDGQENNEEAYKAYDESSIASTAFSSNIDVIGSNWRLSKVDTSTSTSKFFAATDRFYVIKDTLGNIYKLRFVSASIDDGGERGKPEVEYKLVRAAQ